MNPVPAPPVGPSPRPDALVAELDAAAQTRGGSRLSESPGMTPERSISADARVSRALHALGRETPFPLRTSPPRSLADRMRACATPGVSIGIVERGEVVWEGGFGTRLAGASQEVAADTLFQAGSISKPVFAVAVMRLAARGALDLDEDVNAYLTSWRIPSNDGWSPRVTLRQLLSHSAGTSVHGFPGYPATGPWPTLTEVLEGASRANTVPIVVEGLPGAVFRYSGGGTTIAQQVVADVSQRPFAALMRELVLDPAGMRHSSFEQPLPPAAAARAASGHPWNGEPVPGGWHVYPEMAAAGLWTTAGDLARLGAELMRILRGGASALGLERETVAAMLRPQLMHQAIGGKFMGIGWFCDGEGASFHFSHGGQNHGFLAHMQMYPERDAGAAVMINAIQGWPLTGEILAALGREFGWADRPNPAPGFAASAAKDCVGTYRRPGGAAVHIASAEDGLTLQFGGQQPVPLIPHTPVIFVASVIDLRVAFDRAAGLTLHQFGTELRFDRDDR